MEGIEDTFRAALALHHKGQLTQAKKIYQKVLTMQPNHSEALHLLGVIEAQSGNHSQAVDLIGRSIEINPVNARAHNNRGNALRDLRLFEAAIESYDKAIALDPHYTNAAINRSNALNELKRRFASADDGVGSDVASYALADAHYNRGVELGNLQQHQAAIESYDKAIALNFSDADAYTNRGNALSALKRHEAAIDSYDKAILIQPNHAQAYANRGISFQALRQSQAALESYDKAIAIKPDLAEAYYNRGIALNDLKQYQAAIESYDFAMTLKPDAGYFHGVRLNTKLQICDWRGMDQQVAELVDKVRRDEKASHPFPILGLSASSILQRRVTERWRMDKHPASAELGCISKRAASAKIRLAYFSMDFRIHSVSILTAELFETHDRDRFEVYGFSFGPDIRDEMRIRLEAAFDKFIDVHDKSDREIAELSRHMEVDIAIDLAGFTADSRPGIFAVRAAPIQVNYLGYPGTMGAEYMDYLIADQTLIPEESQQHYTEKIVYLPCFQANDSTRQISDKVFTREELGLPELGFVFCCFNNNYKITPATFDGWMRILKQVDGSVLFLYVDNELAATNLRKEAEQRGVDANRLVFGTRLPVLEYLARYRSADLFLDTLPFNGGTTASNALWAGLPVLTCTGEAFASRMAASLLTAIDLPELITGTQEEYEALAIELATDADKLKAIKQKLRQNRLSQPLFDTKRFTRNIENAYTQMVQLYQADLAPDHIYVKESQPTNSNTSK